jgi:hypothetical protein
MKADVEIPTPTTHTKSLSEYAADLVRSGTRIVSGAPGTFWATHESAALMRRPIFLLTRPSTHEVHHALWSGRAAIASYLQEPDERHPANAWLYLCTDHSYSLENLGSATRRNVRRGLGELAIAPLTAEDVLAHGADAFCDTRRRAGLSDGTPEVFRRLYAAYARLPEYAFLGAWKDGQLAAFLTITEVEDWVEIGDCSMDALLQYRPNDTLLYCALSHYLVERGCRVASFGVSTIQSTNDDAGLHRFKLKLGFEAVPVHRAFVPHPFLRPFTNRATLWGVNAALRFRPGNRRLRKVGGALVYFLSNRRNMDIAERDER